jgi:hypothetical protein
MVRTDLEGGERPGAAGARRSAPFDRGVASQGRARRVSPPRRPVVARFEPRTRPRGRDSAAAPRRGRVRRRLRDPAGAGRRRLPAPRPRRRARDAGRARLRRARGRETTAMGAASSAAASGRSTRGPRPDRPFGGRGTGEGGRGRLRPPAGATDPAPARPPPPPGALPRARLGDPVRARTARFSHRRARGDPGRHPRAAVALRPQSRGESAATPDVGHPPALGAGRRPARTWSGAPVLGCSLPVGADTPPLGCCRFGPPERFPGRTSSAAARTPTGRILAAPSTHRAVRLPFARAKFTFTAPTRPLRFYPTLDTRRRCGNCSPCACPSAVHRPARVHSTPLAAAAGCFWSMVSAHGRPSPAAATCRGAPTGAPRRRAAPPQPKR